MTVLLDYGIKDEPALRRAQIIEVVVEHCAHVLWPDKPEKLHLAQVWAQHLKNAIRKHKDRLKSAVRRCKEGREGHRRPSDAGDGSAEPVTNPFEAKIAPALAKSGGNGLSVGSADVILCKDPPRSRGNGSGSRKAAQQPSHLPNGAAHPSNGVSSANHNGASSSPSSDATTMPGAHDASRTPQRAEGDCTGDHPSPSQDEGPSPPIIDMAEGLDETESGFFLYREGTAATTPDGAIVFVSATGSPLVDPGSAEGLQSVPLHVKRLSGGITNELFHVYDNEDPTNSVVVRVYGKETERVISRESELFYQSLFIDTYVHGRNFLVYRFLDNYETLPYTEMPVEAASIARATASFQVKATLASRNDTAEPLIDEEPPEGTAVNGRRDGAAIHANANENTGAVPLTRFDRESNYTIRSLTKWVEQISSEEILEKVVPEKRAEFKRVTAELTAESREMLAILAREQDNLGEGVCHNDLLSANIMRNYATRDLKIIDFDYTKRDFLLFDAANHFNEYTGLECDYARYFPDDRHMAEFVSAYREAMRAEIAAAVALSGADYDDVIPGGWELFWGDGVGTGAKGDALSAIDEAAEAAVVVRWTELVKFLTLCSHLSWSIWSLVQEAVSLLDVDFLDYAKLRLKRYYETKAEYTQKFTAHA